MGKSSKSPLQQAIKIIAGSLVAAAAVPTVALLGQGLVYDSIQLGEWLPTPEHHSEPKHGMGGILLTSASTSGAFISIDMPTPMADVFLVTRAEKTVEHEYGIGLATAVRVVEEAAAKPAAYYGAVIRYDDATGKPPVVEWSRLDRKATI